MANNSLRLKVNYDKAKNNYVKTNVEEALKIFLGGNIGDCFCILPQALNPFLKAVESIGMWNQVIVLPGYGDKTPATKKVPPTYLVMKVPADSTISLIESESK